jgi:hypothetical protein
MSDNMSNSILKNLSRIVLNFELSCFLLLCALLPQALGGGNGGRSRRRGRSNAGTYWTIPWRYTALVVIAPTS